MEEIKLNMKNLTKEEREQLLKLVEKANKEESKVWKPALNEEYYTIDYRPFAIDEHKGGVCIRLWTSSYADSALYDLGLCFKTPEEAKFAYERQKLIAELERFAKEHNDPAIKPCWLLRYDNVCSFSSVIGMGTYNYGAAIIPAFTSEDIAMKAVDVIGKDRLKKYYFGVEE